MSSQAGVGALTAELRRLLLSAVGEQGLGPIRIINRPAELPATGSGGGPEGGISVLGLILYRITVAPAQSLPVRDPTRRALPPTMMDLHYLVTAESALDDVAEDLLSRELTAFHLSPILVGTLEGHRSVRSDVGDPSPGTPVPPRVAEEPLEIRDLASIWRMFGLPWRPSAGVVVLGVSP